MQRFVATAQDVSHRVPARYLNYEPKSAEYRRFRAALLVSEILEPTFEKYFGKVQRCIPGDNVPWAIIEQDAYTDYMLATEFQQLTSAQGVRSLLS